MKYILPTILIAISCYGCSTPTAQNEQLHEPGKGPAPLERLGTEIDHILDDSLLAPSFIGIEITTAEEGTVFYERNSTKLFHPASNMKLLTTATALHLLGSRYEFVTRVTSDARLSDGVLNGNIYIKGSGDPLLTTEHLDSIALLLRRSGIRKITGNLIGDITRFDDLGWGMGWMWDDEPSSDAAFISPLTVNDNCVDLFVSPGQRAGQLPELNIVPKSSYWWIRNTGITSRDTSLPALDVSRVNGDNTLTIKGRIPPDSPVRQFTLSVPKPELYFLKLLNAKLSDHEIELQGRIIIDSSRSTNLLLEFRHTLDSVLHQINKPSDNLAAENLLKTIAAVKKGEPGSAQTGLGEVKQYLQTIGVDTTKMILADGSGLSWYNAVSPDALVKLLRAQYKEKSSFQTFYESLPVAGVNGTLKNRMKGTRAEGNVHAKTGSLTGVSSLSGYVTTSEGQLLVFSILCNHFPGENPPLRNAQNALMQLLAGFKAGDSK